MDLHTVGSVRMARTRDDLLGMGSGDAVLAGGTWLHSEPQPDVFTLVDLSTMGWESLTVTDAGLSVAATCTLAELVAFSEGVAAPPWPALALFRQCCTALASSSKVWREATFGGNIALSLPAGAMTSLAAALDGIAVLWPGEGGERRLPVREFVTGPKRNQLQPGEVLRSVELPLAALRSRTAYRKISLSPLGRSGSVVIARLDESGECVVTITAATERPHQLRFGSVPSTAELSFGLSQITDWYDDPHGSPDWRAAVSLVLAQQVCAELTA